MTRARTLREVSLFVLLGATVASAQGPLPDPPPAVEGRAYGSRASLLGGNVDLLTTSDTGSARATASGTFDETARAQSVVEVPGVIRVVTSSDSRTFGEAFLDDAQTEPDERCDSMVVSTAGVDPAGSGQCTEASETRNAVVDVVPGEPSLVRAVTTCSQASISGAVVPEGRSFLSALEINGTVVPVTFDTETVIVSEALPLVRINHQRLASRIDPDTGLGAASIRQEALRVQALDDSGQIVQVVLSSSQGELRELPEECPIFRCPLPAVDPTASFVSDGGCIQGPDQGDVVEFRVDVKNVGRGEASMQLVHRIPMNVVLDAGSVQGPTDGSVTVGSCPAGLEFNGCVGEPAIDPARQCITVDVAELPPDETRTLVFQGSLTSDETVCSTSVATLTPLDPLCNRPPFVKEVALVIPACDPERPTPTPTHTRRPEPPATPTQRPRPTATPDGPDRPRPTATPAATGTPGTDDPGLGPNPLHTTGSGGCAVNPRATTSFDVWPLLFLALLAARRRRR